MRIIYPEDFFEGGYFVTRIEKTGDGVVSLSCVKIDSSIVGGYYNGKFYKRSFSCGNFSQADHLWAISYLIYRIETTRKGYGFLVESGVLYEVVDVIEQERLV